MRASTIASWGQLAARALERRGVDVPKLFRAAGLNPDHLGNSCARYPVDGMQRMWQLATEASGNPDFGLEAAECWTPTIWHALGYAWLASSTLRDAFERTARYGRLVSDAVELELSPSPRGAWFRSRGRAGIPTGLIERSSQDAALATVVRMSRLTRGEIFCPLTVRFAYPRPARTDALEAFFKAPLEFDSETPALEIGSEDLDAPLITSNAELARVNEQVVVDYLARFDRRNLSLAVRTRLLEQLPSGQASEHTLAAALNMTPRTMQRRLRDEGTTYKALLEEVRSELATQYVRQSDLSINEITYLLGFSEPSNFTRAFKRWTGSTPSAYRDAAAG